MRQTIHSFWHRWRRQREADRRGWGSLGRMMLHGEDWSAAKLAREVRRSNRLYRLANGKSPWRPYKGF